MQLLRNGGVLSFITSNKYMRAGYGEKIRSFLPAALTLSQVVDFGDLPVFTAAAYPAIVVGQKQSPLEGHSLRVADLAAPIRRYLAAQGKPVNRETVAAVMERLPTFLAESAVPAYPQVLLRKTGWILEDPALVRLFDRLMSQGTPLGKFVNGRMYYGIKTGLNDAFVINEAKRHELIQADPRSAEVIKPWLRGRDIKRWRVEPAGQYLIAIQNSDDKDARNPWGKARTEQEAHRIFRRTYPAIHDHLSRFEQYEVEDKRGKKTTVGLRIRQDHGKWWWELRACKYYREFAEPKVVWPDIVRLPEVAWDTSKSFLGNTAYVAICSPAICSLLNSKIIAWCIDKISPSIRGGYVRMIDSTAGKLPIPTLTLHQENELMELLRASGERDSTVLQDRLDSVTAQCFGLSDSELGAVRSWYQGRLALATSSTAEESEPEDMDNEN